MEPSTPTDQAASTSTETWHAPLNKVTWLSKVTAAIVFITLPFVGFWVGLQQRTSVPSEPSVMVTNPENEIGSNENKDKPRETTPIEKNVSSEVNETVSNNNLPKNSTLISARTGVFQGYLSKKVVDEQGGVSTCDTFVITKGEPDVIYTTNEQSLKNGDLPYEIFIGNGDMRSLPINTQEALASSSASSTVYAVITDYVFEGGKDRMPCESTIDTFIALHPSSLIRD